MNILSADQGPDKIIRRCQHLDEKGRAYKKDEDDTSHIQQFMSNQHFSSAFFNFILFLPSISIFNAAVGNKYPDIMRLATPLSPSSPFVIKVPSKPSYNTTNNGFNGVITLLYFLDIAFAVILLYVLRKLFNGNQDNKSFELLPLSQRPTTPLLIPK